MKFLSGTLAVLNVTSGRATSPRLVSTTPSGSCQ